MRRWLCLILTLAAVPAVLLVVACKGDHGSPSATSTFLPGDAGTAQYKTMAAPTDAAYATASARYGQRIATLEARADLAVTPISLGTRKTPSLSDGTGPVAGVCAEPKTEVVVVTLRPDGASPRCTVVSPSQRVRIVNARDDKVALQFGPFSESIDPGESVLFDAPVGSYLAPGDHVIRRRGHSDGFAEVLLK